MTKSFAWILAVSLVGCGSGDNDSGSAAGGAGTGGSGGLPSDTATFDVDWAPASRVIDEASGKDLLLEEAGPDTMTYRFAPSASAIAALSPGDIAVLSGVAYRKVVAVRETPEAIELDTDRTTLPEAITSGTMAWSRPVAFDSPAALETTSVDVGGEAVSAVSQGLDGAIKYEGEVNGFNVTVELTPSAGRLDISASATKEVLGEDRFALTAEGFIRQFQAEGRVVLGEGQTLEFQAGTQQLEGELKVKAAAFNAGASQDLLSIPLGVNIPIQVGPVPLILKVKANINVTLEISITEGSAEAEATFRFSTDQGLSVDGAALRSTGSLSEGTIEGILGGSASYVAAGMAACAEFPRIELAMAGEFASVGLSQNNCATTVYTFDPACNEVRGTITGIGLASLGFFGITLADGQVELYKREERLTAGQCDP